MNLVNRTNHGAATRVAHSEWPRRATASEVRDMELGKTGGPAGRRRASARVRTAIAAMVVVAITGCSAAATAPSAAGPVTSPAGSTTGATASPDQTQTSASPSTGPTRIVVPKASLETGLKSTWGKAGPSLGREWTWQPTVDPDGRIWAASSFDNVFWIFDKDGKYLETWGTPGNGEGQLRLTADGNGYGAVAFGPDGGFYVADSGHSRILQFDKSRTFVRSWGSFGTDEGQFTIPISIATDRAGNVYAIDDGRHDVQEFDRGGTFIRTVATNVGPYFAVDANGDLLAVDNTDVTLYRFASDGRRTMAIDLSHVITFATGMAVAPSGNIVIASSTGGSANFEYENLIELDAAGTLLHVWPNGGEGIALNATGDRLYVTYSDKTPLVRAYSFPKK